MSEDAAAAGKGEGSVEKVDVRYLVQAWLEWRAVVPRDFPPQAPDAAAAACPAVTTSNSRKLTDPATRPTTGRGGLEGEEGEGELVRITLEHAVARRLERRDKKDRRRDGTAEDGDGLMVQSPQELSIGEPRGLLPCRACCGPDYTAILTADGKVLTCGDNGSGKLGHARTEFDCGASVTGYRAYLSLQQVGGLLQQAVVVAVACGQEHMIVADAAGSVYTWGRNTSAQCGLGHKCVQVLRPSRVPGFGTSQGVVGPALREMDDVVRLEKEAGHAGGRGLGFVVDVACGDDFSLVLCRGGSVFAWGRNHEGQCGIGVSAGAHGTLMTAHRVMRAVAGEETIDAAETGSHNVKAGGTMTGSREGKGKKNRGGRGGGRGGGASAGRGEEGRARVSSVKEESRKGVCGGWEVENGQPLVPLKNAVKICAAAQQACAIVGQGGESDGAAKVGETWGELVCWGCGVGGRLGVGPPTNLPTDADAQPHAPAALPAVVSLETKHGRAPKVASVAMSRDFTAAVASDRASEGRQGQECGAGEMLICSGTFRGVKLAPDSSSTHVFVKTAMMMFESGGDPGEGGGAGASEHAAAADAHAPAEEQDLVPVSKVVAIAASSGSDGRLLMAVRQDDTICDCTLVETSAAIWAGLGERVGGWGGVGRGDGGRVPVCDGGTLRLACRKVASPVPEGHGDGGGREGKGSGRVGWGEIGGVACSAAHAVVLYGGRRGSDAACGVGEVDTDARRGGDDDESPERWQAGYGGGDAGKWRVRVWGRLERGQLGLEIGFGALQVRRHCAVASSRTPLPKCVCACMCTLSFEHKPFTFAHETASRASCSSASCPSRWAR